MKKAICICELIFACFSFSCSKSKNNAPPTVTPGDKTFAN
jgi:hypothetical protein